MGRNGSAWAGLASIAIGSACPAAAQTGDAGPTAAAVSAQDLAVAADIEGFLDQAMARFPSMLAISVPTVHRGMPVFVKAEGRAGRRISLRDKDRRGGGGRGVRPPVHAVR
jgi:parvulin-like peptidyl-prolyl isomerase